MVNKKKTIVLIIILKILSFSLKSQNKEITGELKQYHKISITWEALNLSESSTTYLNYRMNVAITSPSNETFLVPAYFAADGNAAETSATSGNKWRCHFIPKEIGTYKYTVSFRSSANIAADLNETSGTPVSIDGDSGSFFISAGSITNSNDFRSKGKLQYVGEKAAKFDNGDYYFEVGSDSPETFLEYGDFDATTGRHDFAEVANNYENGDPSWQNGKGTEIIGAVNYLANQGMNVNYIVLMNITGDGKRTYPFPSDTQYQIYDVSKLDQWQIVFDHMYNKGIALELVLTEQENLNWFEDQEGSDRTGFGVSRKIYYREMIARFGYLNVFWNIGEEANEDAAGDVYSAQQIEDAAEFIQDLSPYNDLVSVHNGPSAQIGIFFEVAGLSGINHLTSISRQANWNNEQHCHDQFLNLKSVATNDSTEWVLRLTEPFSGTLQNIETWTNIALWGSITAGAVGVHYFPYSNLDVVNDDYTQYADFYKRLKICKDFFENNMIPYWNMTNNDNDVSDGYLLSDSTNYFVGYLPNGGNQNINITGNGTYTVKWYDPRNGGELKDGSVSSVSAGTNVNLGNPPDNITSSWVFYLSNKTLNSDKIESPITNIQVIPNPAVSEVFVSLSQNISSILDLNIYDINGKRIKNISYSNITNNKLKIDVSQLKEGLYFVKLESKPHHEYSFKIIIKN